MSSSDFVIEAAIDPREHGAIRAAARQLREGLSAGNPEQSWRVGTRLVALGARESGAPVPDAIVLSLMPFVEDAQLPLEAVQSRLKEQIARAAARGRPAYLLNLFRHVAGRKCDGWVAPLQERILRLNRMAISLSHETGVAVADIDRACADAGARMLGCDWSLASALACEVAGGAIVSCMLAAGLDEVLAPEIQERAKAVHQRAYGRGSALARRIIESKKSMPGGAA